MKTQRVYLDTSVIGGCFDNEFSRWSNAPMQDFRDGTFRPLVSEVTEREIEDAPDEIQQLYAELLTLNAEVLKVDETAIELANQYQRRRILTPKFYDDGVHIALATLAEADVLVSWNFKHIVKFDKIRLFNGVNLLYGYKPLQIYSPREVTTYEV